MKLKMMITLLLAVLLLSGLCGCSLAALSGGLDAAEDAVEDRMDAAEDALEDAVHTAITPTDGTAGRLTKEEAEEIALKHAGFTADQVTYLRTEYEIDDGVPQYEVQFHQDRWEYSYEINAETGQILSAEKDD